MTKQHALDWRTARVSRLSAMGLTLGARRSGGLRLDMATEAFAHRGEQPQSKGIARTETRIEGGGEDIGRDRFLDRRMDRPASLTGILDIARVSIEARV